MKTIRILLAALTALCLLAGCGGDGLVALQYKDGRMTSGTLAYLPASATYEPTAVGAPYAYYKRADLTLYAIGDEDPTLWLTEAYAGGATTIFHAESITLPTWETLAPERMLVCASDVVTFCVLEVADADVIAAVLGAFLGGEAAERPTERSTLDYELKFASSAWPQFYMNLIYAEYADGRVFLTERATRRTVEIGDLLAPVLHPDETDA